MTAAGKRRLEVDLHDLEAQRPAIQQAIAEAREKGDLRENAEYHAAREALGLLEARVNDLVDKLARAQVVDLRKAPKNMVAFGAIVSLQDLETNAREQLQLVGLGEEDANQNRILTTSPVGSALLRKKVGDDVEIVVPRGTVRYKILAISYPT
jgi:transcription elongation factor GreA